MSDSAPLEDVCAVIYGTADTAPLLDQTLAAARGQDSPPAQILVPARGPRRSGATPAPTQARFGWSASETRFAAGVRAAAGSGARWLWLLDGVTVPAPDALSCLLAVSKALAAGDAPLLLASKVVDAGGRVHPDAVPRHEVFEKQRSVEAAARRLVQLRTACHGSLAVRRSVIERFGLPRSDLPHGVDVLEWSARMLRRREDTGYLVPASVATRRVDPVKRTGQRQRWLSRARLLAGDAWSPTEKLWEAFLLSEEVLASPASRRARAQGLAGVGGPGLSPSRSPRRMTGRARAAKRL